MKLKLNPFLEGKKIALRGIERRDISSRWLNWFNDAEITQYINRGLYPSTRESLLDFYNKVVKGGSDLVLAMIWQATKEHIGTVGLHRIDWISRKAELGIVIGEKKFWGRGASTEAVRLITEHGFDRLNLHKIFLHVRSDHQVAIRSYTKAGFKTEATLRQDIYREGLYYDVLIMSRFNPKPLS